jgi:hypothetical protein
MVPPARGRAIERTLLPCRRLRSRPPAGATGKQNAPGFPRGRPALSWRAGLGLLRGSLRSGLRSGALRSGLGSGLGGSALRSGLSSRLLCSDHLFAPHRTMAPVVRKMLTRMHLPTSAMRVDALLFLEVATPRDQRSSRDGPMRCVHRSHHAIAIAWCRQRADSACTTRRARRFGRARVGRTTASDDARRLALIPESQRGSGFPEYRPYAARSEQRTRGRASDPRG